MAGHSASKTRVNALLSRPVTSSFGQEKQDVDARDKRGHDGEGARRFAFAICNVHYLTPSS